MRAPSGLAEPIEERSRVAYIARIEALGESIVDRNDDGTAGATVPAALGEVREAHRRA